MLQVLYDSVGDDGTAFAGLWSSVEAGTGALSLASGGADKFNGVLAQMVDSAGATDTAYQTMTDTFQHSMESLQTTAENLSIDLFEAMEPGLMEAANWGTDCLNTLTSALNESGPTAMLDAASGILEDLTAGVVQMIPGLASAATQVITKLVQYLADHQDEIFLAVDAMSLAEEAGSQKAVNVVLIGAMARRLGGDKELWLSAVERCVPP